MHMISTSLWGRPPERSEGDMWGNARSIDTLLCRKLREILNIVYWGRKIKRKIMQVSRLNRICFLFYLAS